MVKFRRAAVTVFSLVAIGAVVASVLAVNAVNRYAAPYEYRNLNTVPEKPVAIVFGALVYNNQTPCPMLADRVAAAVQLYKSGRVRKLLMTGDNSSVQYDEPTAMGCYAEKLGVPKKDIVLDYAGFNTYDSCYRAVHIFGVKQAILVTQTYHEHRAVTIARTLGMDAVGVDLPDWSKYPDMYLPFMTREWAADVKAEWQLHVTHPKPHFLGEKIPISV